MEFLNPRVWFVIALALVLGFGAGINVDTKFAKAAQAAQAQEDKAMTANEIVDSVLVSQELEVKVANSNDNISNIRAAVHRRGAALSPPTVQENSNDAMPHTATPEPSVHSPDACAAFNLDSGTVWLLNAARSGAAVESSAGGDETVHTASTVTLSAFIDNDLDVVKLYRELAARHDQLVDEVEQKLKQQAGISQAASKPHKDSL